MRFRVWHAEGQARREAVLVEAECVEAVADALVFKYWDGDCDMGTDVLEWDATEKRWVATRKGSPDYFHIQKEETWL